MSRSKDETTTLSGKDIETYARQLAGMTIQECINTGWFEKDLTDFNPENQKRIRSELKKLARSLSAIWGPDEKRKSKKEEKG